MGTLRPENNYCGVLGLNGFVCLFPVQRAWPLRQQVPQRPPGLPQRQSQPEAVVDVSDMILLSSSSHFQCRKFLEIMTLVDQASHLYLSFEVKKMYFVLAVLSSSFPMTWCEESSLLGGFGQSCKGWSFKARCIFLSALG